MAKASGRKRRNKIISLHHENSLIQGDKELLNYATDFYKQLFGRSDTIPDIFLDLPIANCLDEEDRKTLSAPFSF
jgi:hypothetical protein